MTRPGWRHLVAVLLVGTVLPSATVFAQESAGTHDPRVIFEEGRRAYEDGRFDEATRSFRRAYLLSGEPALLYNVGQAELRLGRDSLALEAFEGFLRQTEEAGQVRSEVEERVRVLRSMGVTPATEREVAAAAAARTATSAEAVRSSGAGAAPWVVFAFGAAALVAGPVVLGVGASEAARVTGAADGAVWRDDLEAVAAQAETMWLAGWIVSAAGAALVTTGLVWALVEENGTSGDSSAALRLGPGGLTLLGTFR